MRWKLKDKRGRLDKWDANVSIVYIEGHSVAFLLPHLADIKTSGGWVGAVWCRFYCLSIPANILMWWVWLLSCFYKLWNVGLIWDITIKLGFCGRGRSKPRWVQKCSHRGSMSRLLISALSNKDSQMSNKNLQKSKLISVSNKDLQMLRLLVFVSSKDLQMSNLWQVELSLKVDLQMSITPLRRIKTPDSWRWYKILQPQWKGVLAPKYSSFEEIVKSFPANQNLRPILEICRSIEL